MQESVTQDRELYIGGSDEAIIMGLSPFKTRWQLLREKVGLEENTFTGNAYTLYGQRMEPIIRDYINNNLMDAPNFIEAKKILDDSDVLPTRYHADGFSEESLMVLEIKTTSDIASRWDAEDQGIDYRTFALRHYKKYLCQLVKGMHVFEVTRGLLAVYERPEDMSEDFDPDRLSLFMVDMNDMQGLLEEVLDADDAFREDYTYLKENPEAQENELPSRKKLLDMSHNEVMVGGTVLDALYLLENEKAITDAIKSIKTQFKDAMEERNIRSVSFGELNELKLSLVAAQPDKETEVFDTDKFREDHPDMYNSYLKLKVQKGKTSYVRITCKH